MRLTYWKIIFYGRMVNKNGGISWAFKFKSASFVSLQTFWFSTQLEAISVFLRHPTDRANPPNVWAVELMGGDGGATTSGCFLNFIQLIVQPKYSSKSNTFRRSSLISCCPVIPITWCNSCPPRMAMGTLSATFSMTFYLASVAFPALPQKGSRYSRKALL